MLADAYQPKPNVSLLLRGCCWARTRMWKGRRAFAAQRVKTCFLDVVVAAYDPAAALAVRHAVLLVGSERLEFRAGDFGVSAYSEGVSVSVGGILVVVRFQRGEAMSFTVVRSKV